RRFSRRPPETLLDVFSLHARRRPRHPLLLFQGETHTFGDLDLRSNRAARALRGRLALGDGGGEVVAVFLPNSPAYVWTWLALAKLGCAMACVNTNARGRALRHALEAAGAAVLLASPGERGGGRGATGTWGKWPPGSESPWPVLVRGGWKGGLWGH
ncbi:S27A2 synthetase, partial [Sclerurus mexicanus]|nr:S27A2 synthetase [Sclerurus mexicanus]